MRSLQRQTRKPGAFIPPVQLGLLSRRAASSFAPSEVPELVHDALRSPGQPLDTTTRGLMEPSFGHDFSGVRVHTDSKAAASARAVNALAYTVAKDMVFGEGQYAPATAKGRRLIAHELAHVTQQASGAPVPGKISSPHDAFERDAEAAAAAVVAGRGAKARPAAPVPGVQRQEQGSDLLHLPQPSFGRPAFRPLGLLPGLRNLQPSFLRPPQQGLQLSFPPPPRQTVSKSDAQEIVKEPLPPKVTVAGSPGAQKGHVFEPVPRDPTQFGLDLSLDSSVNFQLSFVARHMDAARFKVFRFGPIDFLHEPTLSAAVSLNPTTPGLLGAQLSTTLLNIHFQTHGQDFIELALGQLGVGFDSTGNVIGTTGVQAEIHSPNPHFSIVVSTSGTLTRATDGTWSAAWNPLSFGLLVHWVNP